MGQSEFLGANHQLRPLCETIGFQQFGRAAAAALQMAWGLK